MKKQIIKKWYKALGFPEEYNSDFESYLDSLELDGISTIREYDGSSHTAEYNLLAYLYFCEDLSKKYGQLGIPDTVLYDTLSDIVTWSKVYYGIYGKVGLAEIEWLKNHVSFCLFKLGRLQFKMSPSKFDIPEAGICRGDSVMEIHIPEGGAMTPEQCKASIDAANDFFAEYFPDFKWEYYTCHSWLLDVGLSEILSERSNILAFQRMFKISKSAKEKSDAIIRYTFRWDTKRENLADASPKSSFAERIKAKALSGGEFFEALGYIKRS